MPWKEENLKKLNGSQTTSFTWSQGVWEMIQVGQFGQTISRSPTTFDKIVEGLTLFVSAQISSIVGRPGRVNI
jgi:hypothetical protein